MSGTSAPASNWPSGTTTPCGTILEIYLFDHEGEPVADERFELVKEGEEPLTGKLDRDGYAKLTGLAAGNWELDFPDQGFDNWFRIQSRPKVSHWVEVGLVDAEGKPVPDEPCVVTKPDGSEVEVRLDSQGKARVEFDQAGMCKVNFKERRPQDWWPRENFTERDL